MALIGHQRRYPKGFEYGGGACGEGHLSQRGIATEGQLANGCDVLAPYFLEGGEFSPPVCLGPHQAG
jgi:hypothetical protein